MRFPLLPVIGAAGLVFLVAGCSSPASSSTPVYSQSEIGQAISQQSAEIINVRDVIITPNSRTSTGAPGAGSRVGAAAVLGAVTGSPMAIAGAMGSVMGEAGGGRLDNKMGEEITVQTKDGRTMTIVQERGEVPLSPGERVVLITTSGGYSGQKVRVVRQVEAADAPIGARTP
ncbi:MAG TPA: hypothetical protein VG838_05470 [Opitutaceae bacterium]|nr:hypothetical protein [Opitutaceae bacterium]